MVGREIRHRRRYVLNADEAPLTRKPAPDSDYDCDSGDEVGVNVLRAIRDWREVVRAWRLPVVKRTRVRKFPYSRR